MQDNIFYTQAIQELRPNEGFSLDDMLYSTLQFVNSNVNKPSEVEITQRFNEIKTAYIQGEYQRIRAQEYPTIADQLDMLYHDIKNGNLNSGDWIQSIEQVKQQYPKP